MNKAEVIEEIIRLQQRVNRAIGQGIPNAWMELSLTIAQLKSLLFIDSEGATNLRKLAQALGVTPANMTGIIDRLVEQRLVSRNENSEDRRMLLLKVTDEGKTIVDNLKERKSSHLAKFLALMTPEELSSLKEGMVALAKAMEIYH